MLLRHTVVQEAKLAVQAEKDLAAERQRQAEAREAKLLEMRREAEKRLMGDRADAEGNVAPEPSLNPP